MDDRLAAWMAALEARHLAELTFSEVSRALRALSSAYVERRAKLARGAALDGAGKRAAFALSWSSRSLDSLRAGGIRGGTRSKRPAVARTSGGCASSCRRLSQSWIRRRA